MAIMRVNADGNIATLVIKRSDGHELSLSSDKNSLIEWDGGNVVRDYGSFTGVIKFLAVAQEFIERD